MNGPDPRERYPMPDFPRVGFLKPLVDRPNIEIGDYTYYDDPAGPDSFADKCVLYHYDFIGDRLIIGRFTALARDVRFVMNGANHVMDGFSTYPFNIFAKGWEAGFDPAAYRSTCRGDTIVGNDVWIGMEAMVMPGVTIGDGAIVASRSVVTSDVAPYAVAGGNPARAIRRRFDDDTVAALLDIAWWSWPVEKITRNLAAIRGGDIEALRNAA
ncbi:MAG: CatB-related O-acetyltransferase [Bauldia sp.]|uniref:CatB-related O-acetyltransferase n=1 Tax=Bauldia sp. TaxID=2575872 RepID=UPI001D962725|nr:CatB-related O-acetyltransferase [Bauldia sp.]MCB1496655.1 CatB-related O-acetyltransferase [Bauldia sp.]